MIEESKCACGAPAQSECSDCHLALCPDHVCSACSRCADDCYCAVQWWTPDFFGLGFF